MASFTDSIPQFNPYVQQLPVDAMVKVGMEKQRRYDEGIQKIQTSIDNIAGLDIMKDVHKNYLQSKLNQLGSNLRGFAAADFSDNQLVSSVSGMTNQIIKDPVIQNAVASTQRVRKEQGIMEAARKEGKSSPSNEWWFNQGLSHWLSDRDVNTSYNDNFKNYVDTDKALLDAIHGAHEDSIALDENVINADGTINREVLQHKLKEGLSTTKVTSIARTVFARPEIKQQLMIDGLYKYKDYTQQQLLDDKVKSLNYQRDLILNSTPMLKAYMQLGDKERKALANKDLEYNYKVLNNLNTELSNFRQDIIDNFDGAKVNSYMEDRLLQAANNYSWQKIDIETKVNPQFTVNMEKSKFNLEQQKFQETLIMDKWNIENIKSQISSRQFNDLIAKMKAEGTLDADGNKVWMTGKGAIKTDEELGMKSFYKQIQDMKNNRDQILGNIISGIGVEYNGKTVYDLYTRDANNNYVINPKYRNSDGLTGEGQALVDAATSQLQGKIDAAGTLHLDGKVDKAYATQIKNWWDLNTIIAKKEQAGKDIMDKYKDKLATSDLIDQQHKDAQIYSSGWVDDQMIAFSNWLTHKMDDTPGTDEYLKQRENDFKDLQRQNEADVNTATLSTSDPKIRENMRLDLLAELQTYTGDKSSSGDYSSMVSRLTKSSGEGDATGNNVYKFKHDRNTGKWYVNVSQGSSNAFSGSDFDVEISPGFAQKWKLQSQLDPKEDYFNSSPYGQILNLYRGNGTLAATTNDVTSPEAYATALERSNIGSYSVGFHLKAFDANNDQYIAYMQIQDKNTGKYYNGVPMDWSALAKLPGLSKVERKNLENTSIVYDRLMVVPAIEQFRQIVNGLDNPDAAMQLLLQDYINK